jgi:hypothetical protein
MSVLDGLAARAGRWRGTSVLQDPMNGIADSSESTATVAPVLGGRFVRVDYTWAYQGQPHEGSLLIGYEKKADTVTGHWIDSFHNGTRVMPLTGPATGDGTLSVRGSYPAPPGPDWGWRIDVMPDGPESLRIVHYNIWPEGKEEVAVEAQYRPE